jgi:ABC-type phosphate transport system auxiliary subunit
MGARLVVGLKKLVRPWIRLYTDHPLSRQAQINVYLHDLGHNLVRELVRLQVEHAALRNRVDALRKELEAKEGGGG